MISTIILILLIIWSISATLYNVKKFNKFRNDIERQLNRLSEKTGGKITDETIPDMISINMYKLSMLEYNIGSTIDMNFMFLFIILLLWKLGL